MKPFGVLVLLVLLASLYVDSEARKRRSDAVAPVQPPPNGLWRVVFSIKPPLVMYDPEQPPEYQYSGYFIEHWRAVAKELAINYTMIMVSNHAEAVDKVINGEADFAVAPPVTSERLKRGVDFSQPVLEGSLQIMTTVDSSVNYLAYLRPFSWQVWALVLAFVIITAHMAWAMERRAKNPLIPQYYLSGVRETIWWSLMTLVFRAVSEVKVATFPGKLLKFVSMILMADYISTLSTLITLGANSPIGGPEDLIGKSVGTIAGTSSLDFIHTYGGITPVLFGSTDEMAAALINGTVTAIIFDSPTLTWLVRTVVTTSSTALTIVPGAIRTLPYAIVVPADSPFQLPLDVAVVKLRESGFAQSLFQKYIAPPRNNRIPQVSVSSSAGLWIATLIMCAFVMVVWLLKVVCVKKKYKTGKLAEKLGYDPKLDIRVQQQQQQQAQAARGGASATSSTNTSLTDLRNAAMNSDGEAMRGGRFFESDEEEDLEPDRMDIRARLLPSDQ